MVSPRNRLNFGFQHLRMLRKSNHYCSEQDIRNLCKQGRLKEALQHLQHDDQRVVNPFTYASFFHACVKRNGFAEGKQLHTHMKKQGFIRNTMVQSSLVTMYAKCGCLAEAHGILNQMCEADDFSWTSMMAAYCKHGSPEKALVLLNQMKKTAAKPSNYTFASVLPACAKLGVLKEGSGIHGCIIRSGFDSDVFVQSALVDMYAKCASMEDARRVFDQMSQRDVVSWNAMISGFAQNGRLDEAVCMFEKMPQPDVISWNAVIAGYAQNGDAEKAMKLFQKMPNRDNASWNTVIGVCVQGGKSEEALRLFKHMQLEGVKPNPKTFASVLPACGELAALELGTEIHQDIVQSGLESEFILQSALMDMYAKCGSLEKAHELFNRMRYQNTVSWTSMIAGYAMHGRGREALELFGEMQKSGVKANHVTFVCVLTACCHVGLVEEGQKYFDSMSQDFHIVPQMENYVCMVDLFGRAGRLDEAYDFIKKMSIKPDTTVWRCLLAACYVHNNIMLGEQVAKHLFELEPENASPYVVLSNLYATAGRWNDMENVRRRMKEMGVRKTPACSWIEVEGQVHAFLVGNALAIHPEMQEIYES
ncbi:pentatricopeptide repeat-containing protein At5g59600 [Cryptomeria japonica]|uniref:pentatricopeptide repeat-containing protein At5g59600 n=1 Tax=Cryptomeria japonica TaxID=3369 RepID=UPI0025AD821C|nr:pentatricopeptide repeat-containing protein At5g59600 [Cryptomeria japonica]XP_057844186.1 pentatricopeptide repeat-containing protein At5g59600 [Cryptomeria japonica]